VRRPTNSPHKKVFRGEIKGGDKGKALCAGEEGDDGKIVYNLTLSEGGIGKEKKVSNMWHQRNLPTQEGERKKDIQNKGKTDQGTAKETKPQK